VTAMPFFMERQDLSHEIPMEGRSMRTVRQINWASTVLVFFASIFPLQISQLPAQEIVPRKAAMSALASALATTQSRGVATVAVITSADQPSSVRFWNEFYDGAWARSNRGLVQLVNVSKEAEPELVREMGVNRFPSVIAYGRGPQGVRQLATITDCGNEEALSARLSALDLGLNPSGKADPAVRAAAYSGDVYASNQTPPSPPQCNPSLTASPPPQYQPQTLALTPSYQPTLATTANVIQVPSQNLMISQAPPTVFLAPTQAPIVYVPQTLSAGPSLSLSPAPYSNAPAGNLFLTTPSVSALPAQQPTTALALSAPAPAPAATLALAANPAAPVAAVTNSTMSLPTSGSRTRVRVRGPGILGSSLARFGERLTRLGRARIETVQETTLEAPLNQGPSVGMATISTTSTTPIAQGPTLSLSPPQQQQPPCQTSSCPAPPPSTLPSPQKQSWHGQ
jgi:hypothetical protein